MVKTKKKLISHQDLSIICAESYASVDFEEANIEVVVRENSVFAFRGTDEAKDVVRDLRILPWWINELGWVPAGFAKASRRLATKVLSECMARDIDSGEIVLTGHSLGGAVALLVGAFLVRDEVKVREIVAYGAPRCGRLKILDQTPVTLYRNGKDLVPMVPPLMRRHKVMEEFGERKHYIRDHFMKNYVEMQKSAKELSLMDDKTVEPNSELNKLDTNGDNVISQEEYEQSERRIRLELLKNEDQKQDQQLRMIWYSLISLLIFPILLIFSSLYGLDDAGKNLTEMSSIFFLTIGGLVSVFFGSQAIKKNGNGR